jgi:seryl-tRNA synthetase
MLDIKWICENPESFDERLKARGLPPRAHELIALDDARRGVISQAQALQERRNAVSKEIGAAKAAKDEVRATALMAEVAGLKDQLAAVEENERLAIATLNEVLLAIPNMPADDVPLGADEHANVEMRRVGTPRTDLNAPKDHVELGERLGLMDFEAAARMSGARFVVLKGALARMERALAAFMLDMHTVEHGYTEVNPPFLVRDEAMVGTAQLPKFREDQFAAGDGYWLIPTAEVPLTNLVREGILEEVALPLRMTAHTPCFRAEAGSAGRDTRGMIRQHQFSKVEMVSITTPEQSEVEHDRMLGCAENILKRLGLPYRVVTLCTGDMGFAARKTYDIEVWLPSQNMYREISSCSNCGDFQARRMDARYRPVEGKGTRFVHTLNGSGLAVGRTLVAVMENYQNADGSITVPEALRPYMGGTQAIGG